MQQRRIELLIIQPLSHRQLIELAPARIAAGLIDRQDEWRATVGAAGALELFDEFFESIELRGISLGPQ
jgi:hypothetical protein